MSYKLNEALDFTGKGLGPIKDRGFRYHENRVIVLKTKKGHSNESIRKIGERILEDRTVKYVLREEFEIDKVVDENPTVDKTPVPAEPRPETGAVSSSTPGIEGKNADNLTPGDSPLSQPGADTSIPVLTVGDAPEEEASLASEVAESFLGIKLSKKSKLTEAKVVAPKVTECKTDKPVKKRRKKLESSLVITMDGFARPQLLRLAASSLGIEGDMDTETGLFVFRDVTPEQQAKLVGVLPPEARITVREALDTPKWDNPDPASDDDLDPNADMSDDDEFEDVPDDVPEAPLAKTSSDSAAISTSVVTSKALDLLADLAKSRMLPENLAEHPAGDNDNATWNAKKEMPELEQDAPKPNLPKVLGESHASRLGKYFRN
jgi:hypothetical protein